MGGKFKLKKDNKCKEEVDDSKLEEYYKRIDGNYKSDSTSQEGFSKEGEGSKDSEDSNKGAEEGAEEIEINNNQTPHIVGPQLLQLIILQQCKSKKAPSLLISAKVTAKKVINSRNAILNFKPRTSPQTLLYQGLLNTLEFLR